MTLSNASAIVDYAKVGPGLDVGLMAFTVGFDSSALTFVNGTFNTTNGSVDPRSAILSGPGLVSITLAGDGATPVSPSDIVTLNFTRIGPPVPLNTPVSLNIDGASGGILSTDLGVDLTPFSTTSGFTWTDVATPTPTPSLTPSNTPSPTPSNTPSPTPSLTPSNTPSPTPSNTPSPTPSNTPSPTPSNTPSPTPSNTPSPTPSLTPSNTPTPTPTNTPSPTPSNTPSPTPSLTPSNTPTPTPTPVCFPVITGCPGDILATGSGTDCSATVSWTPPQAFPGPCGATIISFTTDHAPGTTFPAGSTLVTYTATDALGNVSTCSFTVNVSANGAAPLRFKSVATQDGALLESRQGAAAGGVVNSTSTGIAIGDDSSNRQSKGVFSFDLSANPIPPSAVITRVTLRLTRTGAAGNPGGLGALTADFATPYFSTTSGLTITDFEAPAAIPDAMLFSGLPAVNGACTFGDLPSVAFGTLNRAGLNQFRVHFATPWAGINVQDSVTFASGEGSNSPAVRPELIVEYSSGTCGACGSQGGGGATAGTLQTSSIAFDDGYVQESQETSGVGVSSISLTANFNIGDTATREQLIGLLSFDTTSIPANAFIDSAQIVLTRAGSTGSPASLGSLVADMKCTGVFGSWQDLEPQDLEAYADVPAVATFSPLPSTNGATATANLSPAGLAAIQRGAITQFKLHFATDDNNNSIADYMIFVAGDGGVTSRPRLIVNYHY